MAVISKLLSLAAVLLSCINPSAALAMREPADIWENHYRASLTSKSLTPM
jgi:hypothetical protein